MAVSSPLFGLYSLMPNVLFHLYTVSEVMNYQNGRGIDWNRTHCHDMFACVLWLIQNQSFDLYPEWPFPHKSLIRGEPNAIIISVTKVISNDLFKRNKTFHFDSIEIPSKDRNISFDDQISKCHAKGCNLVASPSYYR